VSKTAHRKAVSFEHTKEEGELVDRILDRYAALAEKQGQPVGHAERLGVEMDLLATHANGCPLDFALMLEAEDFDFVHDINGIGRHLDRTTGELGGCFLPRTAKRGASK
jgi:hypothetical protein